MKKSIYYLSILVLISSCQIYGITNDYEKLSEDERSRVKELDSFSNTESRNIYEINGQQLKKELKNNEKSIVYIFANGCSSEYCVPLPYLENYAEENDYKLYMIMSGYAFLYTTLDQSFTSPLYSIDQEYYGTKYSSKCYRMFVNDITGKPLGDKIKAKDYASFFFFKNGILDRATLKVTD
ncbi:MAG: hypothetical protein COA58_13965 [Bacteroidetes bacterium]|nr:MAG: hypothetical protein COA58_13965 [Bacteroidota bacterium]